MQQKETTPKQKLPSGYKKATKNSFVLEESVYKFKDKTKSDCPPGKNQANYYESESLEERKYWEAADDFPF